MHAQTQAYAHSQANMNGANAKAILYSSVVTTIYSSELTGKLGVISVNVNGPSASAELGEQFAIDLNKQVESSLNMKSMIVAGIVDINYTSPRMCERFLCAD